MDVKRDFFMKSIFKHWKGLPKAVVQSPSLELLKRCVDMALSSMV